MSAAAAEVYSTTPKCQVCHRPMLAGQRERHYVCSPPAECCGWPVDLLPGDHHHDITGGIR